MRANPEKQKLFDFRNFSRIHDFVTKLTFRQNRDRAAPHPENQAAKLINITN